MQCVYLIKLKTAVGSSSSTIQEKKASLKTQQLRNTKTTAGSVCQSQYLCGKQSKSKRLKQPS